MKFTTHDERRELFERLDEDPSLAKYGDAMEHAESTAIGFFGDREILRRDCAKMMLAEVRKLLAERGEKLEVVLNDVLCTAAFRKHYAYARHPNEDFYEVLAGRKPTERPPHPGGVAHVDVADEIADRLHGAEYWSRTARGRKEW